MPTRVQLPDGNIGEFPDGMSNAQIEAVLQKQFPPKTPPKTEGFLESLGHTFGVGKEEGEQRQKEFQQHPIREILKRAGGPAVTAAEGGFNEFMRSTGEAGEALDAARAGNPYAAVEHGMYALPLAGAGIKRGAEQLGPHEVINPAEAGTALGTAIQTAPAFADAAEPVARRVAEAPKGVARFVTRTTPKVTKELVKETKAGNEAATAKAAEQTAKQQAEHAEDVTKAEAKRKVDLRKHFEKTQTAKEANETAQGKVSRKEAINRGVERLDTEVRSDLEKTEDKVNAEANRRYNDLRKVLKDEPADPYQPVDEEGHAHGEPITIVEHLYDVANEPLRGTETETPIIKSLGKRTEQGDVELTYNDLQGYREEVGRELRKGSLPPDVFTAYKNLISAIDDAMGRIAERNGLKPQQDAARAYYRQYAETFLDRDAVARKALDSKERGGVAKAYQGKDQSGIEQIARFDPQVAQRLNNLRGYQGEAKALPSKPGKLTTLPKLAPKPPTPEAPPPVQPELKKLGTEDVRGAKLKSLEHRVGKIRSRGEWIATGAAGYRALTAALRGDFSAIPPDLLEGAVALGGVEAISRLLESPKVVEILTRPTEKDIAQIPPEMRGDLSQIAQIAAKKGIQVDPRLYAAAGTPQRKRVAAALAP